ncbi:xanthine dehydrogenase molybdopterin binding subunit [Rhodocaloribacter sp.]
MKNVEAPRHTRGASRYVDDVPPPAEMLYAAVYGSPVAHGVVHAVHTEAARAVEGVVAVLTAADVPGENQIGSMVPDEPLLAEDTVHYEGQPVAVVVARTPEAARRGVAAVTMDVEALPAVTDPREAYEKGEIIGAPRTFTFGDVERAWAACDLIVEGTVEIGGQEHVYLETQRARAFPLEDRRMRVCSSTQSPYAGQRTIARVLGLAHHDVEVDVQRLGGGFGGKEDQATPWACFAALAAAHTGRPVEIVLRRDEDLRMTGKRHPYVSEFRLGVTKTGKILAYDVRHFQNAGAAADLSPAVLERTLFHSTNAYYVPNARIFGVSCRTNLTPHTAFRGFGGPQGMFVMECALAKAAEALGRPREELQRRNLLVDGDVFPYGQTVERGRAVRTWEEADEAYDFEAVARRVEAFNAAHFERKKGFAVMPVCFGISFTTTWMNQASALLHVYTDGSVSLTTGGIEMGQGLYSNLILVASRAFGIRPERIHCESTNTTRVANMSPSAASATTLLNGNAVLAAVEQIMARLRTVAAEEMGFPDPDRITVEGEKVFYAGRETEWDWERLVSAAYFRRVSLSAHGFYATPNIHFDKTTEKGRPFAYHTYGTALVEVTVDALLGTYEIDSVKIVHDLGRTLNPLIDLGQVEGGLAQGLGWMTMEDLRWDDAGRLLSRALATYKVPDVYFMPDDLEVRFLENADEPTGPYGNKAVGEPPLMYGLGVFFALRRAMRAFRPGADLPFAAPMTPERVLMALHPEASVTLAAEAALRVNGEATEEVRREA